jgi:hypothetical protein
MKEKSDYLSQTLLPAISMGLLTLALSLAKTGRDALFFQGRGLFQFPMAYMLVGLVSLIGAALYVRAMKIWGARACRTGSMLFAAIVLAILVPALRPGNYPALMSLFIFIPTVFGILFANIWLLASDLFAGAPKRIAARSFSRIGASALAGGMTGGLLAKGLAPFLDPEWLVLLAAVIIVIAAGVVVQTHVKFPAAAIVAQGPELGQPISITTAFSKNYARGLLLIAMTAALAGILIDFLFYAAASSARMDSRGNANFFANFYTLLYFSSLVVQLLVAPKIQDRLGLLSGLIILPLALLGGATFVTAAGTALTRSALKVTEGGLKASIHRSIWEQAFIPVETKERSFVKMFVDGIGARAAESIGAIVLFVWLMQVDVTDPSGLDVKWIVWFLMVVIGVWLFFTRDLRRRVRRSIELGEIECARFPDQCPCTTEWGKGIA